MLTQSATSGSQHDINQIALTIAFYGFDSVSKSSYRCLTPKSIAEINFIHNDELE
jgi:hypothetical protein